MCGQFAVQRRVQLEQSVARYLEQLDTCRPAGRSETIEPKKTRLKEKPTKLKSEMAKPSWGHSIRDFGEDGEHPLAPKLPVSDESDVPEILDGRGAAGGAVSEGAA